MSSVTNKPKTSLQERLTLAMRRARVSTSQLARDSAVSSVAVHKWLSGQTKVLRHDTCLKAAAALRVSPEWLNHGEGSIGDDEQDLHDLEALVLQLKHQMELGLGILNAIIAARDGRGRIADINIEFASDPAPKARKKRRALG